MDGLIEQKLMPIDAVPVPLSGWARVCGEDGGRVGLAPEWYVVLGGASGQGKSLFAANCIVSAMTAGHNVCLFSLEMGLNTNLTRLLAIASGVDAWQLEKGERFDATAAREAGAGLVGLPGKLWTNRLPVHDLERLSDTMRVLRHEADVRLFVLDYLQLVRGRDDDSEMREMARISNRVLQMTTELRVSSIGVSQYNKATSQSSKRPTPEGLIGASALRYDAHQVVLLDHSRFKRSADGLRAETWALIAKNRHGPEGEIPISWDFRTLRVSEREIG